MNRRLFFQQMNDFPIILMEFGGIMGVYALYALIVCGTIQFCQFNRQLSDIPFQNLLTGNLILFMASTLFFIVITVCSWYEVKIFGSSVTFHWLSFLLAFCLAASLSCFFQIHTGLQLKSPGTSCLWNALFLTLPHILMAIFFTIMSNYKYGH